MAQMELDEIFFNALMADADLVLAVSGRIESTCFEVSPDGEDNTQLPCIIVTDDGLTNQPTDKDVEWESSQDRVQASVEVSAKDPKDVKTLIRMVRKAIATYVKGLEAQGVDIPYLVAPPQTDGVNWDWMKPCYYSAITYQCDVPNDLYDYGND